MDNLIIMPKSVRQAETPKRRHGSLYPVALTAIVLLGGGSWYAYERLTDVVSPPPTAVAPPQVVVATPLSRALEKRLGFLGQFSAKDRIELRAQVGGILTDIKFRDGEVVQKGDLLFVIDPQPYQIRLSQAKAQLETAQAKLELADREFARAQSLAKSAAGTAQNVDQRQSERQIARAEVDDAQAQIQDANFDLDHCKIVAPFTGRIGSHLVSVGNLVSGSRAGAGSTTLLATLVSTDPVFLDFDMSEADYLKFSRVRAMATGPLADKVEIALGDEDDFKHQGTLDFVDNVLERSSGTLHARATVANQDLLFTPGQFARLRTSLGAPIQTLLIPDASVIPDQSDRVVMTVNDDGTVVPKKVEVGEMRGGLRTILSGLASTDRVMIQGIPFAAPGSKVQASPGTISFDEANGKN